LQIVDFRRTWKGLEANFNNQKSTINNLRFAVVRSEN